MSQTPLLLLVDDDPHVREVVGRFAATTGFEVASCSCESEALAELHRQPTVALVDLQLPDGDGLSVLRAIRERTPSCAMVLMTGYGTIPTAVEAIKLGAADVLTKPLDFARLRGMLDAVLEEAAKRRSLLAIESDVARRLEFCGMIGRSAAMQEVFTLVRRLAPHVRYALVTGETGTGKELLARALHRLGPRHARPFVPLNSCAVVETLCESELFGHVRGAFTGATENKVGVFEAANGGTLFLDEIGELPLSLQAKLLRVLETGEIQRVGSTDRRTVDVHVFAATNRDLHAEVTAGRFRVDLFYRLNIIELKLPPLREHREDIPFLTAAFVREFATCLGKPLTGITAAAERILLDGRWEGNVRELRNVIERACILAEGEMITERELMKVNDPVAVEVPAAGGGTPAPSPPGGDTMPGADPLLAHAERDHILTVLERTGGNKKAAAQLLGVSRRKLYRYLEQFQVPQRATAASRSAR